MKKIIACFILFIIANAAFAQQAEIDAVKKTINNMFDAMRKGDSTLLHTTFAKGIVLHALDKKKDRPITLASEDAAEFLKAVGTPHEGVWDERITFGDIKIDAELASVWTPYKFYLSDKFSHCGINFFQLMKTTDGWKIIYIVDTRRRDNCPG